MLFFIQKKNKEDRLRIVDHTILCIVLLLIPIIAVSQNLVTNPSFEEPVNFDIIQFQGWHKVQASDTPDYFDLSNKSPHNNIFDQYIGGIKPKSGNCFVGIFCFRINRGRDVKNIREFIEAPLIQTLEKDSLYKVELSLCLDAESNIAIKNFGILFTQSPMQYEKDFKLFTSRPQVEYNSTYLDSTHSWMTLQSLYKAQGFEKYIALGNFKSDKLTITKKMNPVVQKGKKKKWDLVAGESSSYYYIDDIIIEKTPRIRTEEIMTKKEKEVITDTFNINKIKIDSAIVLKNIIFEFDKYDLLPQSFVEIDKVYKLMTSNPTIRIKLEGHTDNIGSYDFNLRLSLKRVESVVKYLVEKGINPNRVEFAGYSFSCPIASNETPEGRKINRRVVFKIIEK